MKQVFRKYWAIALMFILVTGVCLLFSVRKSGMFIDEIYTYGLSNSSYAPFLSDVKGGSLIGETFTRQELEDYLTVGGGEGFDFGSVYYNQSRDVHPPLYYWLFNIASTLTGPVFTKWTGLILDYIIYMLALILLYRLAFKLFGSREIAAAEVILYGVSIFGTSTMLMIRMYVLLMLFTLCLASQIKDLMESCSLRGCILAGVWIFLGLMTQYYFVFYAFFLCAAFVIYLIIKRRYKDIYRFVPCAFAGVLALVLVFPSCLTQLFADALVSGGSALKNLGDSSIHAYRLRFFFGEARHGLKAAIYVGIIALAALLLLSRKLRLAVKLHKISLDSLVIIVPAFFTFILVALISPVDEQRYIYNIAPIFVLAVCLLLYLISRSLWAYGEGRLNTIALLLIAAASLLAARSAPPMYLYPEYREYDALVEEHSAEPCVYFTDDYFEPITQDLIQLMHFDEFYVTDQEHMTDILPYVGDTDSFVAYIDISEYWSSGYDADALVSELMQRVGVKRAELLYQNGLSATYVLYM